MTEMRNGDAFPRISLLHKDEAFMINVPKIFIHGMHGCFFIAALSPYIYTLHLRMQISVSNGDRLSARRQFMPRKINESARDAQRKRGKREVRKRDF